MRTEEVGVSDSNRPATAVLRFLLARNIARGETTQYDIVASWSVSKRTKVIVISLVYTCRLRH